MHSRLLVLNSNTVESMSLMQDVYRTHVEFRRRVRYFAPSPSSTSSDKEPLPPSRSSSFDTQIPSSNTSFELLLRPTVAVSNVYPVSLPTATHPVYGAYLTPQDLEQIQSFLKDFVLQSLIPFMEQTVQTLYEQLIIPRKGLAGRFFTASKKYFGSNKSNSDGTASGYIPGLAMFVVDRRMLRSSCTCATI